MSGGSSGHSGGHSGGISQAIAAPSADEVPVVLLPATLAGLDRVKSAALVVTLGPEERPPWGLVGWVDWRLHFKLSTLILEGTLDLSPGECLMTATEGRMKPAKLFVFGKQRDASAPLAELIDRMFAVAGSAGIDEVAIAPPTPPRERDDVNWPETVVRILQKHMRFARFELLLPPVWIPRFEAVIRRDGRWLKLTAKTDPGAAD